MDGQGHEEALGVEPITLAGKYIRLEPLSREDHLEDLIEIGSDSTIFRWLSSISTPEEIPRFVDDALSAQQEDTALPFAIVLKDSGTAIGTTRFGSISREHRRVEIGWTWITPEYQRTGVNTEAKYQMLSHAFEGWGCRRVELKTDSRNRKSRKAIERLGATEEGTFRQHFVTNQGLRDTVYYSILDTEWPLVKRSLKKKLNEQPRTNEK